MKARRRVSTVLQMCCLAMAFAVLVAPVLWLVDTSFMFERETLSLPPHWWPHQPTLTNYLAFVDPHRFAGLAITPAASVRTGLLNSLAVASAVALLNVIVGSLAAYSLARMAFRGSSILLLFYVVARLVPPVALMIPTFLLMRDLGLIDNLGGLVILDTGVSLPFTIWVLRSYFKTIPRELEEAAWLDGCSLISGFVRVVVPIAAPGLVAAGILGFLTAWGDFVYPVVLIHSNALQTMPLVIADFATGERVERSIMTAAGVVAILPPILLSLLFQRFIVSGLTSGATKG